MFGRQGNLCLTDILNSHISRLRNTTTTTTSTNHHHHHYYYYYYVTQITDLKIALWTGKSKNEIELSIAVGHYNTTFSN
jgi:hypothetical protein